MRGTVRRAGRRARGAARSLCSVAVGYCKAVILHAVFWLQAASSSVAKLLSPLQLLVSALLCGNQTACIDITTATTAEAEAMAQAQEAAGPSRIPFIEVPLPSSSVAPPAARVPADTNDSSHGSTTQESSRSLKPNGQDGTMASVESDDDDSSLPARSSATYDTSNAIVHRAFRPRTGALTGLLYVVDWVINVCSPT